MPALWGYPCRVGGPPKGRKTKFDATSICKKVHEIQRHGNFAKFHSPKTGAVVYDRDEEHQDEGDEDYPPLTEQHRPGMGGKWI